MGDQRILLGIFPDAQRAHDYQPPGIRVAVEPYEPILRLERMIAASRSLSTSTETGDADTDAALAVALALFTQDLSRLTEKERAWLEWQESLVERTAPKTSEEALVWIQEAMAESNIEFGSDQRASDYDREIQEIYHEIWNILYGRVPRRNLWVADGQRIDVILPLTELGHATREAKAAVAAAGERLGILLQYSDLWEDAALRLRALRTKALQ